MYNKIKIQKRNFLFSFMKTKNSNLCFTICMLFFSTFSNAQCAMCRASLESEGNASKAQAVNDGIVYLMIIPYILAAVLGYIIYRMYKNKTA
jgi:hypothetical protein